MDEFRPTVAGKPRELQGFLNAAIYHPIAGALARALVPTPVTPNMVSVFGAVMVVAAGVFYTLIGGAWGIAIGFLLHLSWHVVDGADGMLARLSGRASPRGEVVDGMCDYFGHGILYALLAAQLDGSIGWVAWAIAVGAGVSRAVQSVYAESARRSYQWWVYDVPWLQNQRTPQPGLGGALSRAYLWAWNRMSGATSRVDALVVGAAHDAPERRRIADLARAAGTRTLPVLAIIGANPRTILLGLSMIAGSPLWFFLTELVLLNLVLALAIAQGAASARRIVALVARGR
ncbi:CDP-alcohol phosphatidyltransferase family protein [Sphingomonas sp. RHCKR47]|uniref:CDP-alcohol phosphatidyltransferase family protein n=1 Tax=Sphingomonas citricola TaxID=2862498 RepID=UPI001C67D271|nr:CDP-alcohol phosphatidyltransferase family protein [Sphingomonas citricola]MBW6522903.1 CDP-alcohol phosphatidyltransferase family protein [Sphingomonas citricola]